METKGIYTKLLEIQTEWIALKKDASNPFFKSKYVTLDNIISEYNAVLSQQKVVCYHYTKENKLITVLLDTEDGSSVESEFNIFANDPQKQGSEITYGKRYNLGQLLNVQTDVDDDGNLASKDWNTKSNYPDNSHLEWIQQSNIDKLKGIIDGGWTMTMAKVRESYKVSKESATKLNNLWIK